MVGNSSGHRRRGPQRLVDAAEVVEREPQHAGRAVVLKLLAEGIRQARESPHAHTDAEILAFNVTGADALRIGAPGA